MRKILEKVIAELFDAKLLDIVPIGGFASGDVDKIIINKPPFQLAVKRAKNEALLQSELVAIRLISSKVDIKMPKIYYEYASQDGYFIMMEYFDGVDCSNKYLLNAPKAIRLSVADQIADNIIKLQQIHAEKFGELLSPSYDTWNDYYKPLAQYIYKESSRLLDKGLINKRIYKALTNGICLYDHVFDEPTSPPTLIHGDYWAKNIMIDRNYRLIGVLDPFNTMWADSEYELFALNALYGKKLPVLEAFLSKETVSKKFFLKNAFYILFSEVLWVIKLEHDNTKYLMSLVKNFKKQLLKFGNKL